MISSVHNDQSIPGAVVDCAERSVPHDSNSPQKPYNIEDRIHISEQARDRLKAQKNNDPAIKDEKNLSEEEKHQVDKLKKTDQDVKAHERAHMAAGSGLVMGGASYEYQRGPDGKMYAVGGEVKIDTSRENDPQATIRKMQKVRRAALAPAQPSGQDRSVAAQASQIEAEARIELQKEKSMSSQDGKNQMEISPASIGPDPFKASDNTSPIGQNLDLVV
jgi:hypothetical protein